MPSKEKPYRVYRGGRARGPIAPLPPLEPREPLPGAPPLAALVSDQQASLLGQGCVAPGPAKITFGTGWMLDLVLGPAPPGFATRGPSSSTTMPRSS